MSTTPKKLYEQLAELAVDESRFISEHGLKIIQSSAIAYEDALTLLADNERVILEQKARIENLESFAHKAKDRCFDIYMNLTSVLPLIPVKDEKPAKTKKVKS